MNRVITNVDRAIHAEYVSTHLLPHTALLVRVLGKEIGGRLTRTEAGILRSLEDGPRRVTELAELEGLAQPTTTLVVKRLEQQGLVLRERSSEDQRVVLVSLTGAGGTALDEFRSLAFAALRVHLDAMPDEQIEALTAATRTLGELIGTLLSEPAQG
jgi:DNA-binding MarR family transcriptional regulator